MDSEVIKAFNKSLISMQECKEGIVSKQKVVEITKAAMNAVRYFKHVVFIIERYLAKCRHEFKIPALYVMDSILRQAKKQYKHKDVFAPRFAVNLTNTISNVLDCESSDRLKVVRVINLWQAHQIFTDETIESVLRQCKASGLEVEAARVERLVKGEKADMQLYQQQPGSAEKQPSNTTAIPTTPTNSASFLSTFGSAGSVQESRSHPSLDERLSQFTRQKLGRSNSSTTTPRTIESSGPKTPPLEDQDHRISTSQFQTPIHESAKLTSSGDSKELSGPEVIQLVSTVGVQLTNIEAVQRLHQFLNDRVQEQLEIERRRKGNITNLLSRDFDYSDEEEEGGHHNNGGPASSSSPVIISKEKMLTIARTLIGNQTVQEEMQKLASNSPQPKLIIDIQSPSPTKMPFPMPDFSVPPPNFANVGAKVPTPGLFMPFLVPTSVGGGGATLLTSTAQQQSGGFSVPPPTIFTIQQTQQQQPKEEGRGEHHRDRDHHHNHRERRGSGGPGDRTSGGRKRTREWSPDENVRGSSSRRDDQKSSHRSSRREDERDRRDNGRRRSRSGSPRNRDRERGKEKEKEQREQREQLERERRKVGLPSKPKADHVIIASRTLWFGRMPALVSEQEIIDAVKEAGLPEKVTIVASRACAYVTMPDRKLAFKILDRMAKDIRVQKKNIKLDWAKITCDKEDSQQVVDDYWIKERGVVEIPISKLPNGNVDNLLEGAWIDLDTLPAHLRDRYTNTGIKEQQQMQAIQLPPNIALPQMPAPGTLPQIMPGLAFNPAALTAMFPQIQMTGLMASLPPPGIPATTAHFTAFAPPMISLPGQQTMGTPIGGQAPPMAGTYPREGYAGGARGGGGLFGSQPPMGRGGPYRGGGRGRGRGGGGFEPRDYNSQQQLGGGYRGGGRCGGFRGSRGADSWGSRGGGRGRGGGGYQRYGSTNPCNNSFGGGPPQNSDLEGNDSAGGAKEGQSEGGNAGGGGGFSNGGFGGVGSFGGGGGPIPVICKQQQPGEEEDMPPGTEKQVQPQLQQPSETESDAPPGLD